MAGIYFDVTERASEKPLRPHRNEIDMTASAIPLSQRDRAVLRAVAVGRCEIAGQSLLVDGLCCCDQFVGARLTQAGLIAADGSQCGPARLTASGQALLLEAA